MNPLRTTILTQTERQGQFTQFKSIEFDGRLWTCLKPAFCLMTTRGQVHFRGGLLTCTLWVKMTNVFVCLCVDVGVRYTPGPWNTFVSNPKKQAGDAGDITAETSLAQLTKQTVLWLLRNHKRCYLRDLWPQSSGLCVKLLSETFWVELTLLSPVNRKVGVDRKTLG